MKNRSLLYILHIDWNWIYQRPQILAHFLEKEFDVTVLSKCQVLTKQRMGVNAVQPKKKHQYYIMPRARQLKPMAALTKLFEKIVMWCENISNKDVVWFCQPNIMDSYLEKCKGIVVYDCMDDYAAMESDVSKRQNILELEDKMCHRANLIFVSSQSLINKLLSRGVDGDKIVLVRNGCNNQIFSRPKNTEVKETYTIGYVGTIAEWMNFELLQNSIKKNKSIQYNMVGPCPTKLLIETDGINFIGRVDHEKLYETIKDYDCLVMPFVVNSIIESVDPVKLYEYISYGKCIISVYYDEIKRFSDYVYFYHSEDEYIQLINDLCKKGFPPKFTASQQKEFLDDNTWDVRGNLVCQAIKEKLLK